MPYTVEQTSLCEYLYNETIHLQSSSSLSLVNTDDGTGRLSGLYCTLYALRSRNLVLGTFHFTSAFLILMPSAISTPGLVGTVQFLAGLICFQLHVSCFSTPTDILFHFRCLLLLLIRKYLKQSCFTYISFRAQISNCNK